VSGGFVPRRGRRRDGEVLLEIRRKTMAMTDLIPWGRGRNVPAQRGGDVNPFLALHREMNRLFDDVFRGVDLAPFGDRFFERSMDWPNIEVSETDKDVKVAAELPGLDEKDVEVEFANGLLSIRGEKKIETEDKDRRFSERYYGHFDRRIPVENVDEDKVSAAFKNGVLTVTMPKVSEAQSKVKRIAINGK
jgi:HSP20 family protein